MNPALIPIIGTVIDKLFPDKNASDTAKLKLLELQQSGELAEILAEKEVVLAQLEVNKTEAANADPFTSRWRPFIGWVCGTGLAYQFLVAPLLTFLAAIYGSNVVAPELAMGDLITILLGMLGLGGLRTTEKIKGVA
jgi:hypothetical protein